MRFFIIALLLFFSLPALAESIDFVSFSKKLLDTESLRSPVYTKKLIRQTYQNDEKEYNELYHQLDELKKQDKITSKEYAIKTNNLKKIYESAHKKSLSDLSTDISNHPVDSLYQFMMTNNRRYFLWVTTPEFQNKNAIFIGSDIAKSSDIIDYTQTDENLTAVNTGTKSSIRKINKKKLGQKSYSIKLNAFE